MDASAANLSVLRIQDVANARMAKSADAADLKSAGRKAVGVQVPLWAPRISMLSPRDFTLCPPFRLQGLVNAMT
jgi:hypothetical protein